MKKKPLALIITDTHLHKDNIELVTDIFQQAILLCKKLKIKKILHGGDIFTARIAQPLSVLIAWDNIVDLVRGAGLKITSIVGNHDKTDQEANDSYLDLFHDTDVFDVVFSNGMVVLDDDVRMYMLSYFKEGGDRYIKSLSDLAGTVEHNKRNFLLTHTAVNSVRNNDGSEVENGIGQELFKKFDKVFIGHYHNQSQIGDNIFYIGSAYQSNFGEDDQKGFTILYSDGSHEFMKSEFPEFIKMKLDVLDVTAGLMSQLTEIQRNNKDHVRVVLTGDSSKLKAFDRAIFSDIGIDVKLEADEIKVSMDAAEKEEFVSFNKVSIIKTFDEFCELNEIEDKEYGIVKLNQL